MNHLFLLLFTIGTLIGPELRAQYEYETETFHSIDLKGKFDAILVQGEDYSVTAIAPEAWKEHISIKAENGVLTVSTSRSLHKKMMRSDEKVEVHIQFPMIKSIQIGEAVDAYTPETLNVKDCEIKVSGAAGAKLEVNGHHLHIDISGAARARINANASDCKIYASGAAELTLNGKTRAVKLSCSGASEVFAGNFETGSMDLDLSGASEVNAWVEGDIRVDASGSSSLQYKCNNCGNLVSNTSGAASVKKY